MRTARRPAPPFMATVVATALALLLAGLTVVPAGADNSISVTIKRPLDRTFVGDSIAVTATVNSLYQLQSVVASVDDRSAPLSLTDGSWTGNLDVSGVPRGEHTLEVQGTDINGSTGAATITVHIDNPPAVAVTSPDP